MVLLNLIQTDSLSLVLDLLQEQKEINKKLVEIIDQKKEFAPSFSDCVAIAGVIVNVLLAYSIYVLTKKSNMELERLKSEREKEKEEAIETKKELENNEQMYRQLLQEENNIFSYLNSFENILRVKDINLIQIFTRNDIQLIFHAKHDKKLKDEIYDLEYLENILNTTFIKIDQFRDFNSKVHKFNSLIKSEIIPESDAKKYIEETLESIQQFKEEYETQLKKYKS
ncbi:hypothetical protein [Flammeovirga sp. EKP202]|uniref:hypothetical protein n=1 Tax=Flammeovirga sp. EKP202 TaxID=2770592 RepID=UPI00165F9673|nr:hypothetical protein [Flammeovirga sp. EKP202]MBD0403535.1 hypothetical protein [Flammeovirga sp. EKP202]